jgi:eukaryotic-like serine/threonine-protein kinase
VLSYASTGHTVPERDELPLSLRRLITACLTRDPAMRPQTHQIQAELTSQAPTAAPQATVLDTTAPIPPARQLLPGTDG